MSDDNIYLRCSCKVCGNHLEFPASAVGGFVTCPHCGQWTQLNLDESEAPPIDPAEAPASNWKWLLPILCAVVVLIGIAASGFFLLQRRAKTASQPPPQPVKVATMPTNTPRTNSPPAKLAAPVKRQKSLDDLKAGPVELEKAKVGSLVYAVGTITNASEFQRFGVQVELDLFGKGGKKLGVAKDYKDIIEPNKEWQYHALIPDPRAASAKVSAIKED